MSEQDFAAFEAQANAPEQPEKPAGAAVEAVEAVEASEAQQAAEAAETVEEGDDNGESDGGGKRRSKPASQRIAELTAKLRSAERELEAYREPAKPAPTAQADPTDNGPPPEPNPEEFEYGEADPAYTKALIKHAAEVARHEAKAEAAEAARTQAQQQQMQQWNELVQSGLVKAEAEAKSRYQDFDAKIAEAVELRGGQPLPPVLSVGISLSPAGADILYRLASDSAASDKLEALANAGNHKAFAVAFGEMEGEVLPDTDDSDLDMADELDMARQIGRMRARLRGTAAPAAKSVAVTNAPEPPKERARGGGGQFEVSGDTSDFAAFERKVMARR